MRSALRKFIWPILGVALAVPIIAAAASELHAYRDPIYITAGFAGIIALSLLLMQPLLIAGYLPGLESLNGRRVHRLVGATLVAAIVIHVGGLWITSPPDVVDALLFRSPTPFSPWGVTAMWAIFAVALMVFCRRRLHFKPQTWRIVHTSLALFIVIASVVHSVLIEGTMETFSKAALCALVLAATLKAMIDLRVWAGRRKKRTT